MKKQLFAVFAAAGMLAGSALAKDYTGEIMDSSCAKMGSHSMMEKEHNMGDDAKGCTTACVKNGAKYVLHTTGKKYYELDDQTKPEAFAGQKVKVTGTLDAKTNTIHVENIAGS